MVIAGDARRAMPQILEAGMLPVSFSGHVQLRLESLKHVQPHPTEPNSIWDAQYATGDAVILYKDGALGFTYCPDSLLNLSPTCRLDYGLLESQDLTHKTLCSRYSAQSGLSLSHLDSPPSVFGIEDVRKHLTFGSNNNQQIEDKNRALGNPILDELVNAPMLPAYVDAVLKYIGPYISERCRVPILRVTGRNPDVVPKGNYGSPRITIVHIQSINNGGGAVCNHTIDYERAITLAVHQDAIDIETTHIKQEFLEAIVQEILAKKVHKMSF
jgi:hypothetical protein